MQERIEQAMRQPNGAASGQGGDLKNRLIDLIDDLRAQEAHSHDPRAQELLEVSAEVLGGLVKSFDDYQRQNHSVDAQTTAPTDAVVTNANGTTAAANVFGFTTNASHALVPRP